MVTGEEIEGLIVKLHKEHKGTREISKVVQKNFSYVGAVLRKRFPGEYGVNTKVNKETQALKLFSQNKSPTQVAIELGLNTDETEKFYKNFWRLERQHQLHRIYDEHRPNLKAFLRFFNQLKNRKMTSHKDFDDILKIVDANDALDDELKDINTNMLRKPLKGKPRNRLFDPINKQIFQQDHETSFPVKDFYTLDEIERAFSS